VQASTLTVDFLSIGQGDAALIQVAGRSVLIDSGTRKGLVLGELNRLGVTSIDLAIGTHAHADHIGSMNKVIAKHPIKLYLDNGMTHTTRTYETVMNALEEAEIPYRIAETGMQFNIGDEAKLTILFPSKPLLRNTRSDHNSNSIVARLDHDEMCFLFMGDAEEPTERALLRQDLQPCQVLKVAHHGSQHSTTGRFLQAVRPAYAVISAGESNRYGHPSPPTLSRLAQMGVKVYRTDKDGTVRATSDGKSVEFSTPRPAAPVVSHTLPTVAPEKLIAFDRVGGKADKDKRTLAHLRVAEEALPTTLHPHLANTVVDIRTADLIFDRVFETGTAGQTQSHIIASAKRLADGRLRLTLAKGIVFHDGTPMRPEDLCFSMELARKRNPSLPQQCKAQEQSILTTAAFQSPLSAFTFHVLPHHIYGALELNELNEQNPVGSGPYTATKSPHSVVLQAVHNSHHQAWIEKITLFGTLHPNRKERYYNNNKLHVLMGPPQYGAAGKAEDSIRNTAGLIIARSHTIAPGVCSATSWWMNLEAWELKTLQNP